MSIVRFRTVVDDTRDTAFVMFAVIVGMNRWGNTSESLEAVSVKLDVRQSLGDGIAEQLQSVLHAVSTRYRILRSSTSKQGTSIDMLYRLTLRSDYDLPKLILEWNQIEGIQSVDGRIVSKENA